MNNQPEVPECFVVPQAVLEETAALLREPGTSGFEGSAVWIGERGTGGQARVVRVFRPEQVAHSAPWGLAVTVTERGLMSLVQSLRPHEIVLARLHTHGNNDVDHSDVDDRNLLVAHPGAVSIVVPRFAAFGIDLQDCGVHVLSAAHRWRRLSVKEVHERFRLI